MPRTRIIAFGLTGIVVLAAILVLTGVLPGLKSRPPPPFTLTLWGPRNETEVWQAIGRAYREELASATIEYVWKDGETYEAELLDALAAGRGPDIFLIGDAALGRYRDKIVALAEGEFGYRSSGLRRIFADGVTDAIADSDGALAGTPLFLDTLALFYNRDHLNAANIPNPPETWEELAQQASTLTRLSSVGGIQRSGAALGTTSNIAHAAEIVAALVYQSGSSIVDPQSQRSALGKPAETALTFYASFSNPSKKSYSWNAFFPSSLAAFAAGETSLVIGYAADVPTVAAQNPQLNFDTAPLPRLTEAASPVSVGRFDVAVVSRTVKEREQAWRFLLWLQSKDAQKIYADAAGLPSARRDLVGVKPVRSYLQPFYDQVLSARTLPIAPGGSLPRILDAMIDGVATRRFSVEEAVARASRELDDALRTPL